MSHSLKTIESSLTDTIKKAIEEKLEGSVAQVSGGGGHFTIEVTAAVFEGKSMLQSQRLVYGAITHLMAGDAAPVHAVDSLKTRTP